MQNIIAGDTFTYSTTIPDFSPDDYTATFHLSGPSSVSVDGVANADGGWDFKIPASQTQYLEVGTYWWAIRVADGDDVFTKARGNTGVTTDPSSTTERILFAEKMLGLVEKAMMGNLSPEEGVGIQSFSVGGRSLTLLNPMELREERNHWIRTINRLRKGGVGVTSVGYNTHSILGNRR